MLYEDVHQFSASGTENIRLYPENIKLVGSQKFFISFQYISYFLYIFRYDYDSMNEQVRLNCQ